MNRLGPPIRDFLIPPIREKHHYDIHYKNLSPLRSLYVGRHELGKLPARCCDWLVGTTLEWYRGERNFEWELRSGIR